MQEGISEIKVQSPVSYSTIDNAILFVGEEFRHLMEDNDFQKKWDLLYQACPWATAFQSREYVTAWYQTFREDYQPVTVVAQQEDRLTGLLTMTIPADVTSEGQVYPFRVQVIGAGAYEAEYQVWMAEEQNGESFIKAALSLIKERFPKSDILLRFLPASTPIDWINTAPDWKNRCVLQDFRRPLLELGDPSISQLLRLTRQHKTKLNRLKRQGEVAFERITDSQQFAGILQDLALQYDFRQGVMFNMNQFKENPLKKDFLMRLFQQGMLHVTILRLDQEVIAAMVATHGKGWVHLQGLNIHSPFYAKHSPGILHFFRLGQSLADEGYIMFDLTPGGDSYKERFATTNDQVYSLAVTDSKIYRLKRKLRKHVHAQLIRRGYRPMTVELNIKKQLYLLRNRLKALRKGVWSPKRQKNATLVLFCASSKAGTHALSRSRNSLQDLLSFENGGTRLTRWEFLEDAMRRFENGQQAYTFSQHGRLLCCAWNTEQDHTDNMTESQHQLELTYCQPEAAGQLSEFIATTSSTISTLQATSSQQVLANPLDIVLVKALRSAGYEMKTI